MPSIYFGSAGIANPQLAANRHWVLYEIQGDALQIYYDLTGQQSRRTSIGGRGT